MAILALVLSLVAPALMRPGWRLVGGAAVLAGALLIAVGLDTRVTVDRPGHDRRAGPADETAGSAASVAPLPAPALTVLDERRQDGRRLVRVRMRSTRGASTLYIAQDGGAMTHLLEMNGLEAPAPMKSMLWRGAPAEGVTMLLELPAERVTFRVVDATEERPGGAGDGRQSTRIVRAPWGQPLPNGATVASAEFSM
jgi:hypothetical protein